VPDRRRHKRFTLTEQAEGTLRVFPDVIVHPHGDNEWIAVGREAVVVGEMVVLEIARFDPGKGERRHRLPVCVIESRPVMVDGETRYQIRLRSGTLAPIQIERQVRPD
jgi:hypothetical protein